MKPSTRLLKALCVALVLSLLCAELAEAATGKDTRGRDNRKNKEKQRQKAEKTLGKKVSSTPKTISWCLVTGNAPSAESKAELKVLTAVMGNAPHTTIPAASKFEDEASLKSGILEKVKQSNCKYTFISTGGTKSGMNFDRKKKAKTDLNKVKIEWSVKKVVEGKEVDEPHEFWKQLHAESPFGTSACSCQIHPEFTDVCMNRANSPLSLPKGRHGFLLLPRGDIKNAEEMKTYQHIQDQTTLTETAMPAWFEEVRGLQLHKDAKACFAQLVLRKGELAIDYYSFEPSKTKGVPFELTKATHEVCNK